MQTPCGFVQPAQPSHQHSKHFVKFTVIEWANVTLGLTLIMVTSLNLLPFNAILSFGQRKKSHGTKGRVWNDILFFA
jgi:hypothetical protein